MGSKKLEKKYKDIFDSKELLEQVREFDEQLNKMKKELKNFDQEVESVREKPQKKIRDF